MLPDEKLLEAIAHRLDLLRPFGRLEVPCERHQVAPIRVVTEHGRGVGEVAAVGGHLGLDALWQLTGVLSGLAGRTGQGPRAWLHLDTGMNRLGLRAATVATLAQRKDLLDAIELDFVMTHVGLCRRAG
ncbi:MAG: alanine racemase, partial [Phyllobacteriaceae bacterium]|nr:alanine racemase [Phyllobacteriaceae bacterium]